MIPFGRVNLDQVFSQVPFYRPVVMEKNVFRGVVEDVTQVGVINVLVTHERIAEPVVHAMAKTIVTQPGQPAADEPAIQRIEESFRSAARQRRGGLRVRRRGFASGRRESFSRRRLVKVVLRPENPSVRKGPVDRFFF